MRFRYLRDPVFLLFTGLYVLGRALRNFGVHHPLFDGYFNDVLCAGVWVPVTVAGLRRVGIRRHDLAPTALETVLCLGVWAIMYKVIFPQTPRLAGHTVADPADVTAYALGGLIAIVAWRWLYAPTAEDLAPNAPRQA
ncbi:MAG: hypothetical protein AAF333_04680 [Planctomycetota bacterium]